MKHLPWGGMPRREDHVHGHEGTNARVKVVNVAESSPPPPPLPPLLLHLLVLFPLLLHFHLQQHHREAVLVVIGLRAVAFAPAAPEDAAATRRARGDLASECAASRGSTGSTNAGCPIPSSAPRPPPPRHRLRSCALPLPCPSLTLELSSPHRPNVPLPHLSSTMLLLSLLSSPLSQTIVLSPCLLPSVLFRCLPETVRLLRRCR